MSTQSITKANICGLNPDHFATQIDGKETALFVLKNKNGMELCISNYGATVMAIMAPDKNGVFKNVVLGHGSIDALISNPEPYLGTVVGRYANRIALGKFTLEGKEYDLAVNNGPNSLHGGLKGFNVIVWDAEQTDAQTLKLQYTSADGEEGYPGNLEIRMTYHLSDDNEFRIDYEANTDKTTLVNLTNHAFFNLAGIDTPSPSIVNHELIIHADHFTPIDATCIPTGEIRAVAGTPFDFTTIHAIGERIENDDTQLVNGKGYDHNYVLNKKEAGDLTLAAECREPESGRWLKVFTTEPGLQLYTGNWLNGFEGMFGTTYPERSAVCFEAQRFPDSPNKSYFPTAVLRPEETYRQTTIYQFGA